jgi:hypothetical protein
MSAAKTPAQSLRRAAALLRERAADATPGPWSRPLNTRYKATVTAPLPEGEQGSYVSGIDPRTGEREHCGVVMANTWSNGKHYRKRSGRDLEYIAALHPGVGLLIADQWDAVADGMEILHATLQPRWVVDHAGEAHAVWGVTLAAALAYLGEAT